MCNSTGENSVPGIESKGNLSLACILYFSYSQVELQKTDASTDSNREAIRAEGTSQSSSLHGPVPVLVKEERRETGSVRSSCSWNFVSAFF